ncbi:MAG: ATP-binding protein [Elusimicrobia bacterium]|nr:ATP-binding protein [Elusimicrobiota bacterium]
MFKRILAPFPSHSFFLFGPRGTGKTTLLRTLWKPSSTHFIDLLDPVEEDVLHRDPRELERRVAELPKTIQRVVIDEIQKVPRLLDVIHRLIESTPRSFILTGSSARKLKRGVSNLLAGRAFVYHLYPLTANELDRSFRLLDILQWGSLPTIFQLKTVEEKVAYLRAYALTYMKEEIFAEQIVRRLDPFRNFLEVAAQCNGQILNYSRIAQDIGVDTKTVQSFFSILEDTLVGYLLPAYHRSVRKRQNTQPKFYFFDLGVKRALERTLEQALYPKTYAFGQAFEHFVLMEIVRLSAYQKPDWRFFYLRTKDGVEVDLIVDRPGQPTAFLEIKSTERLAERDVASLVRLHKDLPRSEVFCLSQDPHPKRIGPVRCYPWWKGLAAIDLGT